MKDVEVRIGFSTLEEQVQLRGSDLASFGYKLLPHL
jgi:hypothetical protein